MSLKRSELQALVDELRPLLVGATAHACRSIELRKFIFLAQKDSEAITVLYCLQEPFLRWHRWSGKTQGTIHPLTRRVEGLIIQDVSLLNRDRIIKVDFSDGGSLIAELFPRKPNLYFIDRKGSILFSLNPVDETVYKPPANPFQDTAIIPDPAISSVAVEALYREKEHEAALRQEKLSLQNIWLQRVKRARKKVEKAQREREKCNAWEAVQHEGVLLQANLFKMRKGMTEIIVDDWMADGVLCTIALDSGLEPHEEIAKRFKNSKKLKSGLPFAEKWLGEAQQELERCEKTLAQLDAVESLAGLSQFKSPEAPPKLLPGKTLPYHEFQTEAGLKIWVGKNAQGNEKLTFSLAKGSDWWLHVSDYPGSHVVLRVPKNSEPDSESLLDALQVALAYSKAKDKGDVDIIVTQCKYVSRLKKGAPGKVQISKHQTQHACFDSARFDKIKSRVKNS